MDSQGSITQWLDHIKQGNSLAAQSIWEAYFQRLVTLARHKLKNAPRRVADEEDLVVNAFNSFYCGVAAGRFPRLADRDDLWQILVMLTARKAANQIQHQNRKKRGGGLVRGESIFHGLNSDDLRGIDQVVGTNPSPEFANHVIDQCGHLLQQLGDATLERIAIARLEGFTNAEIAEQLKVRVRTVERKLRIIREIWSGSLD